GGLMMPWNADAHSGIPLVILNTNPQFQPDYFLPDGINPSFPAQSLVARGLAVLQLPMTGGSTIYDPALLTEGPEFVARVESAIVALAEKRHIDSLRVGLVGHSRTGFQTYYAITHPGENNLAAAVVVDSFTGDYPSYLQRIAESGIH